MCMSAPWAQATSGCVSIARQSSSLTVLKLRSAEPFWPTRKSAPPARRIDSVIDLALPVTTLRVTTVVIPIAIPMTVSEVRTRWRRRFFVTSARKDTASRERHRPAALPHRCPHGLALR